MKNTAKFLIVIFTLSIITASCAASKSGCGLTSDANTIENKTLTVKNS